MRSIGQTIGAIIAEDSNIARQAAKLVKVTYEDLPAVLTIQVMLLLLKIFVWGTLVVELPKLKVQT